MSADCTGVSAVAASNEHIKAPAKARVFMASLPSSPVRHWPGIYSLLLASCISVDAIPSAGSVVPCAIGGQYPIAAWLGDDRDPRHDAGCPEQTTSGPIPSSQALAARSDTNFGIKGPLATL